jgi:hypothetical protein
MKRESETPQFCSFEDAMRTILSVSHDDFKKYDAEWRKARKSKKRTKSSASRVPAASA